MKYSTISIIIPVYNEEKTINDIVMAVKKADTLGLKKEIIIVDDCSKDGSRKKLNKLKSPNCKMYFHSKNQGKGAALRTGLKNATGDILLIQDADLEYRPDEYPLLLDPILHNQADVVYGSRLLSGKPHRVLYYWHSIGNRFLTWVSNVFTDLNLSDMETCYKVFTKEISSKILSKLSSNRFGFEPEFTARVAHIRPRPVIYEVGISYQGRTYDEGKKIGWKDALEAIWCIMKFNIICRYEKKKSPLSK